MRGHPWRPCVHARRTHVHETTRYMHQPTGERSRGGHHPTFDAKELSMLEFGDEINRSVVLIGGVALNKPTKIGIPWHRLMVKIEDDQIPLRCEERRKAW